jgi:hypothetical protein
MSIVTIQGNASGTGTLTVTSPNTNSNFTLTLPEATTILVGTDATQTLTNKTLTTPTLTTPTLTTPTLTTPTIDSASVPTVSGTAPLYMARAWVNFNGTGVVAIRASGNVSSITDNGTGDYTVNFTTAMPDANYSTIVTTRGNGNAGRGVGALIDCPKTGTTPTTTTITFAVGIGATASVNGDVYDSDYCNVSIFR